MFCIYWKTHFRLETENSGKVRLTLAALKVLKALKAFNCVESIENLGSHYRLQKLCKLPWRKVNDQTGELKCDPFPAKTQKKVGGLIRQECPLFF